MAVDCCSGWCVIRELPEDWEIMQAWSEKLGVESTGPPDAPAR
jgi:hypothetical protein